MEELLRINKCLETLRDAPSAPAQPITYSEFLLRIQKLKNDVNDQLNHVKSFNYRARKLTATIRQEIPNIIKLCNRLRVGDSPLDQTSAQSIPLATPVIGGTPRPFRKTPSVFDNEINSLTPKRQTPISMSKMLLRNKFVAQCSPKVSPSSQTKKNRLKKPLDYLDSTPEMPTRKQIFRKSAAKKLTKLPETQPIRCQTVKETSKLRETTSTLSETTPVMKERITFFMNPNVGNIHQRYVAMQHENADESTCLLSSRVFPKTSSTPEMPTSCQKKKANNVTPSRTTSSTPPLPFSSTKKPRIPVIPYWKTPNSDKKRATSRTPSPPKDKFSKTRTWSATRTKSFHRTAELNVQKREPEAKSISFKRTPEIPKKKELRGMTVALADLGNPIRRTENSKFSQTLLETPVLRTCPFNIAGGDSIKLNMTDTLRNCVFKDNSNLPRKKKLLAFVEETPKAPKKNSKETSKQQQVCFARSATMPTSTENASVEARPSKMLRNQTVAL